MAVRVQHRKLSAAIPINLRSPLDGRAVSDPLMFSQGVGNLNPYCHPSCRVVCVGCDQLQSDTVSSENGKALRLGWLATWTVETQDIAVEAIRRIKCRDRKPRPYLKCVGMIHVERVVRPNDPSSATRPTRAFDCNRDARAGFAAAHG